MMDTLPLALVVALAALQLLDWYTTRTIIRRGGREMNPLMARLFEEFGMDPVLAIKAAAVSYAGWWIGQQMWQITAALVAFYAAVVIHNFTQMKG